MAISLLTAARSGAATVPEETIGKAVERGVAALRRSHAGPFAGGGNYGSGPTSLVGLTLLECGISPDDEQVRRAAAAVRDDCPTMNRTYSLALAVMFLDRLDDPADEPLIHVLGVRLLEGQCRTGGWTYTGRDVSAGEAERVRALLRRRAELKTAPDRNPPPARPPIDPALLERIKAVERTGAGKPDESSDNSNTQFAVLGVWVARRHGLPCDFALRRCEAYFRATHVGGAWPYTPGSAPDNRVANTCAGLLGLAIGFGVRRDAKLRTQPEAKDGEPPPNLPDPMKDVVVQAALTFVGRNVGEVAATGLNAEVNGSRGLYFLWSVERVGMVYSVPVMGGVDWYQAGASAILRAQKPDGSWTDHSTIHQLVSDDIATSFALLFLRKSNFARDLTANLLPRSRKATLRSGGDKADAPAAIEPTEAERLAGELPAAAPDRQEAILEQLRGHKGAEYTDALARVIPKLAGDVQKKARDALAERLARMTADTLRAKLKDANAEVRRASALACAMKEDKALVPDLITALDDADSWVVRAAAVSLRLLTGQDFGPAAGATAADRAKAVAAWKAWWKRQSGR